MHESTILDGTMAFRITRRDVRLVSGLVLFTYVAIHLTNHALGLISLRAAERGLAIAVAIWHSLPGSLLLYGAAATHLTLAFHVIYQRRTLRMPPIELLRIALGLGIPLLLIGHAVSTRLAWELYASPAEYSRVVWGLWTSDGQGRQLALLVPGWLHGCLGLYLAFNRRAVFQRFHYVLFGAALLLPVLAGLGFLSMGKELAAYAADRAVLNAAVATDPLQRLALARLRDAALAVYIAAIAAVFAAREIRAIVEQRSKSLVAIAYPGRTVQIPRGFTVLEASRSFHIPHASMCGGRARCSTCRVRVTAGGEHCPAPGPDEAATLARIEAPEGVRLACQLRPQGDIAVLPLLAAGAVGGGLARGPAFAERELAVMLTAWRDYEAFSRAHLPQEVVFFTGWFQQAVTQAVRATGGSECEIAAGAVLTVFGVESGPDAACRDALAAAQAVERGLRSLEERITRAFGGVASFVVALDVGHLAVGDVETTAPRRLLVAGEAIDVVNRLRALPAVALVDVTVSTRAYEKANEKPWGEKIMVALADGTGIEACRRSAH